MDKFYEVYWFDLDGKDYKDIRVAENKFSICPPQRLTKLKEYGNIFLTREEAEEAKLDVFKRVTGKKWKPKKVKST